MKNKNIYNATTGALVNLIYALDPERKALEEKAFEIIKRDPYANADHGSDAEIKKKIFITDTEILTKFVNDNY